MRKTLAHWRAGAFLRVPRKLKDVPGKLLPRVGVLVFVEDTPNLNPAAYALAGADSEWQDARHRDQFLSQSSSEYSSTSRLEQMQKPTASYYSERSSK
ncbi:hypothetical protein STEG23_003171 [Scotinomys teguina]